MTFVPISVKNSLNSSSSPWTMARAAFEATVVIPVAVVVVVETGRPMGCGEIQNWNWIIQRRKRR